MRIQTEPIGSIPRPVELILAIKAHAAGHLNDQDLQHLYDHAVSETIRKFESTVNRPNPVLLLIQFRVCKTFLRTVW